MCKTTFVNKLMFSTINLASYFGTLTCAMRKFYLVKNLFGCLGVRVNGKRRFWMSCYLVSPCTDSGTGVISVQRLCFYEEVNLVSLIGPMLTLCFSPVWCYPGSALDLTVGGFRGAGTLANQAKPHQGPFTIRPSHIFMDFELGSHVSRVTRN